MTPLDAARAAQHVYLDHHSGCFKTHCRECRDFELMIKAAFARADAAEDAARRAAVGTQ